MWVLCQQIPWCASRIPLFYKRRMRSMTKSPTKIMQLIFSEIYYLASNIYEWIFMTHKVNNRFVQCVDSINNLSLIQSKPWLARQYWVNNLHKFARKITMIFRTMLYVLRVVTWTLANWKRRCNCTMHLQWLMPSSLARTKRQAMKDYNKKHFHRANLHRT